MNNFYYYLGLIFLLEYKVIKYFFFFVLLIIMNLIDVYDSYIIFMLFSLKNDIFFIFYF